MLLSWLLCRCFRCPPEGDHMDVSMIQNVSAAVLRSKGKAYPVTGVHVADHKPMTSTGTSLQTVTLTANPSAAKSPPMKPEAREAVQNASTGIQKQQGIASYARHMQMLRDNRFRTRYDLLL